MSHTRMNKPVASASVSLSHASMHQIADGRQPSSSGPAAIDRSMKAWRPRKTRCGQRELQEETGTKTAFSNSSAPPQSEKQSRALRWTRARARTKLWRTNHRASSRIACSTARRRRRVRSLRRPWHGWSATCPRTATISRYWRRSKSCLPLRPRARAHGQSHHRGVVQACRGLSH